MIPWGGFPHDKLATRFVRLVKEGKLELAAKCLTEMGHVNIQQQINDVIEFFRRQKEQK